MSIWVDYKLQGLAVIPLVASRCTLLRLLAYNIVLHTSLGIKGKTTLFGCHMPKVGNYPECSFIWIKIISRNIIKENQLSANTQTTSANVRCNFLEKRRAIIRPAKKNENSPKNVLCENIGAIFSRTQKVRNLFCVHVSAEKKASCPLWNIGENIGNIVCRRKQWFVVHHTDNWG